MKITVNKDRIKGKRSQNLKKFNFAAAKKKLAKIINTSRLINDNL